jgi:hypothetical protein
MQVEPDGRARISVLDSDGNVVQELLPVAE